MQSFTSNVSRRRTGSLDAASRLRQIVNQMVSEELGPEGGVDEALADLAERWNPLIDPVGRANLVADVDALIADYLRPIRGSMLVTPPGRGRISAMAQQLSASLALVRVSKKEPLRRYILLGILKQLR
jgi:hypothetical protein